MYGDYSKPAPQRAVIDAVASGAIDTAIGWGPVGASFAAREPVPLDVELVQPARDGPTVPFTFDISAAVRRDDRALQAALNAALTHRHAQIRRILQRFRVPLLRGGLMPRDVLAVVFLLNVAAAACAGRAKKANTSSPAEAQRGAAAATC